MVYRRATERGAGGKLTQGLITPNTSRSERPLEVNQQYFPKFVSRPKKVSARFARRGPHLPLLPRGLRIPSAPCTVYLKDLSICRYFKTLLFCVKNLGVDQTVRERDHLQWRVRYNILNFEYTIYCKYSRIGKMYME